MVADPTPRTASTAQSTAKARLAVVLQFAFVALTSLRVRSTRAVPAACELAGFAALLTGTALLSVAAAWLLAGVLLVLKAGELERRMSRRDEDRRTQ